jgi:TonB family protein
MSQAFANVDRKTRGAERRIFRRRRVRSLAYVELGQGNGGIVLNVSEGGLAVQAVMAVTGDELPDMRLQLAHSNKEIRTKGRVTWTGEFRKLAGIEFVDLSVEALRQIREWIALEEPEERQAETTSRKTLEATDPTIEFPPHLEMPDILPGAAVPSASVPPGMPVSGSSRMATQETKLQKEVSLPRRTFLSAQERASILGELKTEKEAVATAAEELSAEAPSTRSASSTSMPSARSALSETIPVESDTAKIEKRASEFAFPATAISALDETPPSASSPPADRYGFKLSTPSAVVAGPDSLKRTVVLVGAFAIVALGIGWMAGRAGLRGVLKNSESDERAASPAAAVVAAESPTITEIEVVDVRNQRWLIPFQSPSGERAGATPLNASAESQEADASASRNSGYSSPASTINRSEAPVSIVPDSNQAPSAAGNGLIPGELVHRVEPEYPPDALAQGVEGPVKLDAVIDPDGNVKTIQPISGPQPLFAAATDAVRQWRYSPTTLDGRPIQTERQITITFQLTPTASK